MRSKCKWYFLLLVGLDVLLASSIVACGQPTPVPSPPPTPVPITPPTPVDSPSYSPDEVCVYIWSFLPDDLPNGYKKAQFFPGTRSAIYQGNGKWGFEVLGGGESIVPLPTEIKKESDRESWFEEQKEKVTTYELRLTADFYEKTRVVETLAIEKFNTKTDINVSKRPIYPELLVNWVYGLGGSGGECQFEGFVTNVGKIPLHHVEVEILSYDSEGTLLSAERGPLSPDIIDPSADAYFKFSFQPGARLKSYTYRFFSSSGEEIFFRRAPD